MNTLSQHRHTSLLQLISAFDAFDGGCDPDFDAEIEDLERQFAELRLDLLDT